MRFPLRLRSRLVVSHLVVALAALGTVLVAVSLVLALGSLLYTTIDIDRPDAAEWSSLIHRVVGSLHPDATAPTPSARTELP